MAVEQRRAGGGVAGGFALAQPAEERRGERARARAYLDQLERGGLTQPVPALRDLPRPEVAEDGVQLG